MPLRDASGAACLTPPPPAAFRSSSAAPRARARAQQGEGVSGGEKGRRRARAVTFVWSSAP